MRHPILDVASQVSLRVSEDNRCRDDRVVNDTICDVYWLCDGRRGSMLILLDSTVCVCAVVTLSSHRVGRGRDSGSWTICTCGSCVCCTCPCSFGWQSFPVSPVFTGVISPIGSAWRGSSNFSGGRHRQICNVFAKTNVCFAKDKYVFSSRIKCVFYKKTNMPSPSTLGLVVVLPVAPVFAKNKCVFYKR